MSERVEGAKPIKKKRPDGSIRVYYYCRETGDPLGSDPGRARAELTRRAIEVAEVPMLAGLIRDYEASPEWKRLADSTRTIERFHLDAIEAEFGDMPLTAVEQKGSRSIFLEWHAELAEDHPRAADMKLGRLQTILKFGCDREKLDRNPLASFKRAYHSDRSDVLWLPEHFAKLNVSRASVPMKFAAFLALHTGQRRGDLLSLRWRQYDGAGISLVQSKTKKLGSAGRRVYIPATKALKVALDSLRAARQNEKAGFSVDDLHILTSVRGDPYTPNGFRLAWEHAFSAADIGQIDVDGRAFDLHFHDIRGTAITMLAEAGCSVAEIATITGHSLETVHKIIERYLSRTRTLAESAIAKLELRLAQQPETRKLSGNSETFRTKSVREKR